MVQVDWAAWHLHEEPRRHHQHRHPVTGERSIVRVTAVENLCVALRRDDSGPNQRERQKQVWAWAWRAPTFVEGGFLHAGLVSAYGVSNLENVIPCQLRQHLRTLTAAMSQQAHQSGMQILTKTPTHVPERGCCFVNNTGTGENDMCFSKVFTVVSTM